MLVKSKWHLFYAAATASSLILAADALAHDKLAVKDVITALLAMLSTFMGATLAFRLTETKESERQLKEQREALNWALFIVTRQSNAIASLKKEADKFISPFERAINLPALKPPSYTDLIQNFTSLDFMLADNPNLLFLLTVEQECFHQAISSLNVRNDFYVNELQPVISKLRINRKYFSELELEAALGDRLFHGTINGMTVAYDHLSKSNVSLSVVHAALLEYARSRFPGHKFVAFERTAN